MFGRYEKVVSDTENGLYSKGGGFDQELRWDAEMNVVVSITSLRTGKSENRSSSNIGRPYFSATLRVEKINYLDPEAQSEVHAGALVGHFNWLPRDPEFMSTADEINLREALSLGDAIMGFEAGSIQTAEMDQLVEDDGQRARGRKVGVRVKASTSKDGQRTFYDPTFYAVDQDTLKGVDPIPAAKVREMRAAKASA